MSAPAPTLPFRRTDPLDPPPDYRRLADEQPVFEAVTPRGDRAWVITRHADVKQALLDPALSSDPRSAGFPSYLTGDIPTPPGFFMQLDAPDHPRLRRIVSREFLVGAMQALRPRMHEILDELLDTMTADGRDSGDLVSELAYPMASAVICELLGVPSADRAVFVSLTDTVLSQSSPPEQAMQAAGELMAYFAALVADKQAYPSDDLFGRMVRDGRTESDTEFAGLAALLLLAGYDTMAQVIGLGVVTMLVHPDQLALCRAEPRRYPDAVEELLRYLSINHAGLPRAATRATTVGGVPIAAGEGVIVMLNAANRDGSVFPDADAFDVTRPARRDHVAFGHGLHKCVGAALARVELEVVFHALFDRLPGLRLERDYRQLDYRHDMVLYGVNALPVRW